MASKATEIVMIFIVAKWCDSLEAPTTYLNSARKKKSQSEWVKGEVGKVRKRKQRMAGSVMKGGESEGVVS